MKPVDQTTFGYPGGNCFSACVASLLEIPLEQIPYFMGDKPAGEDDPEWYDRFAAWLRPRGFYPVPFELGNGDWRPQGLHILSGPAARGFDHSVIARGSEIVHDPHPSRAGRLLQLRRHPRLSRLRACSRARGRLREPRGRRAHPPGAAPLHPRAHAALRAGARHRCSQGPQAPAGARRMIVQLSERKYRGKEFVPLTQEELEAAGQKLASLIEKRGAKEFVVRRLVQMRIDHGLAFQAGKRPWRSNTSLEDHQRYVQEQWEAYLWMRELNARGPEAKSAAELERMLGCAAIGAACSS